MNDLIETVLPYTGIPVYRYSPPPPRVHMAKRRGRRGRVRSRRQWLDHAYASAIAPGEIVAIRGHGFMAGATAYAALAKHARIEEGRRLIESGELRCPGGPSMAAAVAATSEPTGTLAGDVLTWKSMLKPPKIDSDWIRRHPPDLSRYHA